MVVVFARIRSSKDELIVESDSMEEEVSEVSKDEIQLTEEEQELN